MAILFKKYHYIPNKTEDSRLLHAQYDSRRFFTVPTKLVFPKLFIVESTCFYAFIIKNKHALSALQPSYSFVFPKTRKVFSAIAYLTDNRSHIPHVDKFIPAQYYPLKVCTMFTLTRRGGVAETQRLANNQDPRTVQMGGIADIHQEQNASDFSLMF